MPDPVVITRPLAQAEALAQRVTDAGRTAVVFPLLEIHSLSETSADMSALHAALADLENYALVAFVSPNAIDAGFAHCHVWPRSVPLAIMGAGSRHALAQYGVNDDTHTIFSPQDPAQTDSQTLLQVLDLTALRGKKVLIIRGETGRELLADALRAAGAAVEQVAAYRRVAPELTATRRLQLIGLLETNNNWIVTSSEALHNLLRMAKQVAGQDGVAKMQQQKLVVPHARIAETAQMLDFRDIVQTGSGDERLLAALQSCP